MYADLSEVHHLALDLESAATEITRKAELAVAKTAYDTVATAQAIVPVDTGYLKSTIDADVDGLDAEVGPTAEYGGYVEEGTSKMAAEPYLGPAFDQTIGGLEDALGSAGEGIL